MSRMRCVVLEVLARALEGLIRQFVKHFGSVTDARGLCNLARQELDAGHVGAAARYARWSLAADPNLVSAYRLLGYSYLAAGRTQEAIAVLVKGKEMSPGDAQLNVYLGTAKSRVGLLNEAEDAYRQALRIQPENQEALSRLGIVLMQQGKLGDAVTVMERSLYLKPDDSPTLAALGETLLRHGDYAAARKYLAQSLDRDPTNGPAHYHLAVALSWLSRPVEAREQVQLALNLDPGNTEYRTFLREVSIALSRGRDD